MMLWLAELPPPPAPRAEQAACGHWAQLSHNWIGTGTGPNFANIPVASDKHYLTSKSQPCPIHLISQHLTKSACDSEALKANTVNMSGLLGGNDLHKHSIGLIVSWNGIDINPITNITVCYGINPGRETLHGARKETQL